MPQKYIDMMTRIPEWAPYIGLMASGKDMKSPWATRIVEVLLPLIVAAIWAVPALEAKIEAMGTLNAAMTQQYMVQITTLINSVEKNSIAISGVKTDMAVLKNDVSNIEKAVDSIDDIANTKIRTTEGQLDSQKYQLNDLKNKIERMQGIK